MATWAVRLAAGAIKKLRQVPQGIREIFQLLLAEIELSGPIRRNWPKFGKLSHKDCYHCHLRRGRPTYVAVWRIVDKESRIIEGLMSEPTNEPITTDYVNVSFRIPVKNLQKAKKALAVLGAEENAGSVSWREIFPGFDGGLALKGARKRESLTQKQLAGLLGISQTHISEMEHGKRPIGKEMARRLAQVLKVEYRVFL